MLFAMSWKYVALNFVSFGGFFSLVGIWVLLSIKTLRPTEVALMEIFGKIREGKLYGPGGLCFVPWFFNQINLITFSTEKYLQAYRKTEGFEARTKEKITDDSGKELPDEQKLQPVKVVVDANATFELSWRNPISLAKILRSRVPVRDPAKLMTWIKTAIAKDVTELVGKYNYDEVKGSQKSTELTIKLRKVITDPNHILHRAGFFGDDPILTDEGTGLFDFNVEFVHLPPNVSQEIDAAETERMRLQGAKIAQKRESIENVGALIQMLVEGGFGKTEDEVRVKISSNPKLQEMYFELCTKFTLNDQVLGNGGMLKKYEGLDGMSDLARGLITAASEFGESDNSSKSGNSGGGASSPSASNKEPQRKDYKDDASYMTAHRAWSASKGPKRGG